MKKVLVAVFTVLAAASVAKAEDIKVDFDGKQADLFGQSGCKSGAGLLRFSPNAHEQEFVPAPGLPYLENSRERLRNGAQNLITDTIKDILLDSSAVPGDDLYLSLTSAGEIVIERDGVMVRIINDPVAAQKLYKVLNAARGEVVEAWVEE